MEREGVDGKKPLTVRKYRSANCPEIRPPGAAASAWSRVGAPANRRCFMVPLTVGVPPPPAKAFLGHPAALPAPAGTSAPQGADGRLALLTSSSGCLIAPWGVSQSGPALWPLLAVWPLAGPAAPQLFLCPRSKGAANTRCRVRAGRALGSARNHWSSSLFLIST